MVELMDPKYYKIIDARKDPTKVYSVLSKKHIAKLDDNGNVVRTGDGKTVYVEDNNVRQRTKREKSYVIEDVNGAVFALTKSEMMQGGWSRGQIKRLLKSWRNGGNK